MSMSEEAKRDCEDARAELVCKAASIVDRLSNVINACNKLRHLRREGILEIRCLSHYDECSGYMCIIDTGELMQLYEMWESLDGRVKALKGGGG